jgi:hypothetical protein
VEHREHLALMLPSDELERAYRECEDDFQWVGETFLGAAQSDYRQFVQHGALYRRGMPGHVPQTDYQRDRLSAPAFRLGVKAGWPDWMQGPRQDQ